MAAIVGILGTVAGGYADSQAKKADAQNRLHEANYRAAVAELNAQVGKQAGDYAIGAGEAAAGARVMEGADVREMDKAIFAANNVSSKSGSAADVLRDVKAMTDLDVMTIRNNSARAAWQFYTQGQGYSAASGLETMTASNIVSSSRLSQTASLLSGAGSVADKWYRYNLSNGNSMDTGSRSSGGSSFDSGNYP